MGQVSSKGFNSKHRRPKKSKRFTPKERVEPAWPISQAQRCIRGQMCGNHLDEWIYQKKVEQKGKDVLDDIDLFLEWKKS